MHSLSVWRHYWQAKCLVSVMFHAAAAMLHAWQYATSLAVRLTVESAGRSRFVMMVKGKCSLTSSTEGALAAFASSALRSCSCTTQGMSVRAGPFAA